MVLGPGWAQRVWAELGLRGVEEVKEDSVMVDRDTLAGEDFQALSHLSLSPPSTLCRVGSLVTVKGGRLQQMHA